MTFPLKTVLITGATSGFGLATARLVSERYPETHLILTGRREERLKEIQKELASPCHYLAHDITDLDTVTRDIQNLPEEFSFVDCLVNNAGLALGTAPFSESKLEDFEQMIEVNIKGLVSLTRLLLPGMIERKNGHIINIGSVAGNYPYPGGNVYCGTKAFVNHFSKALRADLKGKNIRVTSVEPGAIETEFSVVRFKGNTDAAKKVYSNHRSLNADHIAKCLLWVMSQPEELNINNIEIMPTDQSFNGFSFDGFEQ